MRINRYIALATGLSRRSADIVIAEGRVTVDGAAPISPGQNITPAHAVTLDGQTLAVPTTQTILFNKPVGYIVSRDGQGRETIYRLLPPELHELKPIGRLDKDSSGLLLLTNDGQLAQQLTHPRFAKAKVYEVLLGRPLAPEDRTRISKQGIILEDGASKLQLNPMQPDDAKHWRITMTEGRNRQIRRTFDAAGYTVRKLHRIQFGDYRLEASLRPGDYTLV
jgi:23S rRNA pseudouridine2605 synthase